MHVSWPTGLLLACACTGVLAQTPVEFSGSASVVQRRLVERAASGARLLTEQGPVGVLQLDAVRALDGGAMLAGRAALVGGNLDYDGQTQAGAALSTTSQHREGLLEVAWRPRAPTASGEVWFIGGVLVNDRNILATSAANGLRETSSALMAGARWISPSWQPRQGWSLRAEAEGKFSLQHRLHVDYLGLLDDSTLKGSTKRLYTVRLVAAPAASPWSWSLEWSRLSQGASDPALVTRSGVPFGTVRQPRLQMDDVGLRVTRRF